jgi:hypothetical protein
MHWLKRARRSSPGWFDDDLDLPGTARTGPIIGKRFYAITVTRTLFDRWAVVREWRRIGQPGTVREHGLQPKARLVRRANNGASERRNATTAPLMDNTGCG